mmetsp:Transcript_3563/g.6752  ORF Transcript_3563/g.6752 Transcript_3563/m.6752 type:complete len:863 (-) Transcript_3563:4838-7426(-)
MEELSRSIKPSEAVGDAILPAMPVISLEPFDAPRFDAVQWLNTALAGHGGLGSRQAGVALFPANDSTDQDNEADSYAKLVASLQDAMHSSHRDLEAALKKALSVVPWAVREVERVRQMAKFLRSNVDGAGERVAGVESGASVAVAAIAQADAVVRKVEASRDLLRRVNEVNRLTDRLDGLFAGGDLAAVGDAIASLREDLAALGDVAEFAFHRATLAAADKKLEETAAPKLIAALEARDPIGTQTARKVFERAGSSETFEAQYLEFRSSQIGKIWMDCLYAILDDFSHSGLPQATSSEPMAPGLPKVIAMADPHTPTILDSFYEVFISQLRLEWEWLAETLPDLRPSFIPSWIVLSLRKLSPPLAVLPPSPGADLVLSQEVRSSRLLYAQLSALAAAKFMKTLMSFLGDPSAMNLPLFNSALREAAEPVVYYLTNLKSLTSEFAKASASSITLVNEKQPVASLMESARKVDTAKRELLELADRISKQCLEQTCGVALDAALAAFSAGAGVFRDSVTALTLQTSRTKSSWEGIQGALKLLASLSSLAREWRIRKDQMVGDSASRAARILEISSSEDIASDSNKVFEILRASDMADMEAALLFVFCREREFITRALQSFSYADSDARDSNDHEFQELILIAQRLVYHCMFDGILNTVRTVPILTDWSMTSSARDDEGDEQTDLPAFSSAPLPYAAELGEQLMNIPQQLEPFMPDDDDVNQLSPAHPDEFLTQTSPSRASATLEEDIPLGEESGRVQFARRWIAAVGWGTMDALVISVMKIPHLTSAGATQLTIDLEYIANVLNALGVGQSEALGCLRELLEVGEEGFSMAMEALPDDRLRTLARQIATIRRIPLGHSGHDVGRS